MKRIVIALALGLSACNTTGALVPSAPAPLAATSIDEKVLIVGLQTFDTLLSAVDKLVAVGVLKPGTARSVQVADAIKEAKIGFQAASAAQRAGNAGTYSLGLAQAQTAIARINLLIKGS